jgi:hypothetical protein
MLDTDARVDALVEQLVEHRSRGLVDEVRAVQ